jgi:hypothetical protein
MRTKTLTAATLIAALAATTLISAGPANAAGPLTRDRSVTALVAAVQKALPDPQFYEPAQHQVSVAEAITKTGFAITNAPVTVAGEYVGQQLTRGAESACILPNPLQVKQRWIAVSGSCEAYMSKNATKIAKTRNLATVTYAAETIAKSAKKIADTFSRPVRLADLTTALEIQVPIDYRISYTKSSVILTSDGSPTATATLTVSGGRVKIRIR